MTSTCFHCGAEKLEPSPCSSGSGNASDPAVLAHRVATLEAEILTLRATIHGRDNTIVRLIAQRNQAERSEKRYSDANENLKAQLRDLKAASAPAGAGYTNKAALESAGVVPIRPPAQKPIDYNLGPDVVETVKR